MISRSEGYRRGVGKEQVALAVVKEFFRGVVEVPLQGITDPEANYRLGDFRSATGVTMECKGQPIDPLRYRQNFVEVFEQTDNPNHADGFRDLARLLGLAPERLAQLGVTLRDGTSVTLGWVPSVSVSIHSFYSSPLTTYVNYQDGGKWIYVYDRQELTRYIRAAVLRGLRRGVGNSNEDTFSVFIPIADKRWQRVNGEWGWAGVGNGGVAVTHIREVLSGETAAP